MAEPYGGVPFFIIPSKSGPKLVSVTNDRDDNGSSSADTFVRITINGAVVTGCTVKGFEKFSIVTTTQYAVWRKENGSVSDNANPSSAYLGMDNVQFCMPYSPVDLAVLESIAKGIKAEVVFARTGNIGGAHNAEVLVTTYAEAQFVNVHNLFQNGNLGSTTFEFKARQVEVKRVMYGPDGKPAGNIVNSVDFVTNTSK